MTKIDLKTVKKEYGKRKRLTRAEAIREFCVECMGYQKHLVTDCPDESCSLWPFRIMGKEIPTNVKRRTR